MAKKKIKEYYEFFDLVEEVDNKLGYDQRDADKHFGGDYKDYWHYQLDNLFTSEVSNDSMNSLYIGLDMEGFDAGNWKYQIQKVYNELFADIADEDGYVEVWIS